MKRASSDLLVLDLNVPLAIAWPNHQLHLTATSAMSPPNRWATCALMQLGFIRLSSNPAVIATALRLAAAHDAVLVTFDRRLASLAGDKPRVIVLG